MLYNINNVFSEKILQNILKIIIFYCTNIIQKISLPRGGGDKSKQVKFNIQNNYHKTTPQKQKKQPFRVALLILLCLINYYSYTI
jgi:hypothetical protein